MAVELSNGIKMPLIGLGTFRIKARDAVFANVESALKCGYRSIDTAVIYRNEEHVGDALAAALPKYNVSREELFITSKLSPKDQGYDSCLASVRDSLKRLRTDYLDLYLIHWPGASGIGIEDSQNRELRKQSWAALERCYEQGLLKAVGVSNYTVRHMEEMKAYAKVMPHVNQVEYHPHYKQVELWDYCKRHGVHLQAYSSLGTTVENSQQNPLLNDPAVVKIAAAWERTPAQILLRWATQQHISVLPKSTNPQHIRENIDLDFDLGDDDLRSLNTLNVRKKYAWDPEIVA